MKRLNPEGKAARDRICSKARNRDEMEGSKHFGRFTGSNTLPQMAFCRWELLLIPSPLCLLSLRAKTGNFCGKTDEWEGDGGFEISMSMFAVLSFYEPPTSIR